LNRLVKHDLVKGLKDVVFEKDKLCSSCQAGKQVKNTHSKKSMMSTSKAFELLHMNLLKTPILAVAGHARRVAAMRRRDRRAAPPACLHLHLVAHCLRLHLLCSLPTSSPAHSSPPSLSSSSATARHHRRHTPPRRRSRSTTAPPSDSSLHPLRHLFLCVGRAPAPRFEPR
jgi:hypothetical protein